MMDAPSVETHKEKFSTKQGQVTFVPDMLKSVSFIATIIYGAITLLSLFIACLLLYSIAGVALSILAMAFSYASQSFYTHGMDKPRLNKLGHVFMVLAVLAGVGAGVCILL